jgi:signal transduction histidine kinase
MSGPRKWSLRGPNTEIEEVTSVDVGTVEKSAPGHATVGATLSVLSGAEAGRVVYMGPEGGVMGRGDEADIVFMDTTISRAHVSIRMHGEDFWIRDLGSSNGTFVDGSPIEGRVKLPPSCRLRVGRQTVLQFTALDELGREREYQRMLIEERLRWEKERSKELEAQAAELRSANEDLEQFAFAASHDLREPLRMVSSYLKLLSQRYGEELDEDANLFINFALDGSDRMQQLLDDLLSYCRLGRGGLSLAGVDMNSVTDQVLSNLTVAIREADANVTRSQLPMVTGNRSQLVQLLQNLVSNAIKFRSEERPEVRITITERAGARVFCVRDNGIGMAGKDQLRIFQIFQRLHSREEYDGTGIGLTIAKKIVDQHGGELWVESSPGEGATFYFTLPTGDDDSVDLTQTIH